MILVVSATGTAEVSFLPLRELEDGACHELDEVVAILVELLELSESVTLESLDDRVHDELDHTTDEDCATSDELDSLTALLSPLTGAAVFSSPQATNPITAKINK